MKKIFNIVIICQLFFAFTLSFPTGVLAKAHQDTAVLIPPVPEDIPFDHKGAEDAMYKVDDKTLDAVALNMGLVLTGVVANIAMLKSVCVAPSIKFTAGISAIFLFAQILQMSAYDEAKKKDLTQIKKNNADQKTVEIQKQSVQEVIDDLYDVRALAKQRRDAGIVYAALLVVSIGIVVAELAGIVASLGGLLGSFTCVPPTAMKAQNARINQAFAFLNKTLGIENALAIADPLRLLTALGMPAAAASAILIASKPYKYLLMSPYTRGAMYVVMLLLQIYYIKLIADTIEVYDHRIDKLKELQAAINMGEGTRVGSGQAGPPPKADGSIGAPPTVAIRGAGPGGDDGQGCVSQSGDPDPSCKGPFMEVGPLNDRFVKLADPTTLGAINDAKKAVNAFASGKNAQGRGALANLAKNKNALRNASRRAIDDINKKLISEKKPPINFSDEAAKIYKDSKAALLKAIANTPGASLSQMSLGVAPPLADGEKEKTEKGDTPASASGIAAIAMPDFGPGSPGPSAASEVTAAPSEKMNSEEAFKGKKLDMNDINKNKDVSIFTVLTVRYKLSAYPKFFKKLETKEAPAPSTIPAPLK